MATVVGKCRSRSRCFATMLSKKDCGSRTFKIADIMQNASQNSESRSVLLSASVAMLKEWLYNLAKQNKTFIKNNPLHAETWIDGGAIELMFLYCQRLNVTREVKYLAVEIFDRFLPRHVETTIKTVEEDYKYLTWELVEGRLKSQIMLRILTSIQLASKLDSHYKCVSPSEVNALLREAGLAYRLQTILASELRLMNVLQFQLNVTSSLTYLEVLLQVLAYNDRTLDIKMLRILALKVLDSIYVNRDEVYEQLYQELTGESGEAASPEDRKRFAAIKMDYVLLATAIIAVSGHLYDPELNTRVTQRLHAVTGIKRKDISKFREVIQKVILRRC